MSHDYSPLTAKEKENIRSYWSNYAELKFQDDLTVLAKKQLDGGWGILYTPQDTIRHLEALGLRKEIDG